MGASAYAALESARDPRLIDGSPCALARPRRGWGDICKELAETPYPIWTVLGPRAAKWSAEWHDRRSTTPVAHHRQFVGVFGQKPGSWGVAIHGTAFRALEETACYNGANICDPACFAPLKCNAQLTECVYWMRSMGAVEKAGNNDQMPDGSTATFVGLMGAAAVFSGLNKDAGQPWRVRPCWITWLAKLKKGAALLNRARKAEEERAAPLKKQWL